jgi:molybdenum cofactor synthesis domain-containing protein
MSETKRAVTAAVLVIGDEILSGRTKDKNIGHIADVLSAVGIDLLEVRIVPDVEARIVNALNALRSAYTYVFTTGGIGPTHDDITADAVAKAFGVGISHDPRAVELLKGRYKPEDLNEARLRMARIPHGADLIPNSVSSAPGFKIGNVFVMAGVPSVMHVMLDAILPALEKGALLHTVSIVTGLKEGDLADGLRALAEAFPDVGMGSYPHFNGTVFDTSLVLRSRDEVRLREAEAAVRDMVARVSATKGMP